MIENKVVMLTTPDCKGCNFIKPMIAEKGLNIEILDATVAPERASGHNLMGVPAFVTEDELGAPVAVLAVGEGACLQFINEHESDLKG